MIRFLKYVICILFLYCLSACTGPSEIALTTQKHVNMSGEISQNSVILQSRLTQSDTVVASLDQDILGSKGFGYFEYAQDSLFSSSQKTGMLQASADNDYMLKSKIVDLEPGSKYYYRIWVGASEENLHPGRTCSFKTLPLQSSEQPVSFTVISCMNFEKFYGIGRAAIGGKGKIVKDPAEGEERRLGFPALKTMLQLRPDFIVGTGDNVYYDSPSEQMEKRAKSATQMRAKWHRQFSMPRMHDLLGAIPFYWEKDDHDYRFNDADTTNRRFAMPSHQMGIEIFREQVPVTDPKDPNDKTYRTHRVNQLLQIWLVEGRDYRSPNNMPDGPEKTLWGFEQREWLQQTLQASDAPFKILISPTPLVGPDDEYKKDNHTNPGGFQYERDLFFQWLVDNGFQEQNFYIINGDRHWQYHSIHPLGFEEFGCGALVDHNARKGREPGDPKSTDPDGIITQPFIQMEPTGGFVKVDINPGKEGRKPFINFTILDENGDELYAINYEAKK